MLISFMLLIIFKVFFFGGRPAFRFGCVLAVWLIASETGFIAGELILAYAWGFPPSKLFILELCEAPKQIPPALVALLFEFDAKSKSSVPSAGKLNRLSVYWPGSSYGPSSLSTGESTLLDFTESS